MVRKDGGNLEFWISQTVVLAATILGVYLASTEGFKLAIHFDSLSQQRGSYYLQTALYNELSDNIETASSLIEQIDKKSTKAGNFIEDYQFDLFIWDSLEESEYIFRIPSTVLNDMRKYYFDTPKMYEELQSHWAYDANQAKIRFEERTNSIKTKTLPTLKNNIETLEKTLLDGGFIEKPVE